MSFNSDGKLDPDEALRLLDLASSAGSGQDVVMLIESKGSVVEGESDREFDDGKSRMDVLGYLVTTNVREAPGSTKGKVFMTQLCVVRNSDAATASIGSLLKGQAQDLKVVVSVFKSGGDKSKDAQPNLELTIDKARVTTLSMLTSEKIQGACEIVCFDYDGFEIKSAPQQQAGSRGAVRTSTFSS